MILRQQYEQDFYGWVMAEAQLLRERKLSELDFENLIEELESMGRSQKSALASRLSQLIFHLLKWQFQPDFRGRSWLGTIEEQRVRVQDILEDNPSLKATIMESIQKAYKISVSLVKKETPIDLKLVPGTCPYTFEQIMDETFYPG